MENFEQEINDKIDGLFSFDDDLSSPINIADKGLGFHHKENALKESQFKVKDRSLKASGHPLPSLSDIKRSSDSQNISSQFPIVSHLQLR